MYVYQPSTPADRLLPLPSAIANADDRLTSTADIRDVVNQLLKLSEGKIPARLTKIGPSFRPEDLVYLSTKGLHIHSQKCKHVREQKKVNTRLYLRWVLTLISWYYLRDVDCILRFIEGFLSHAISSASL